MDDSVASTSLHPSITQNLVDTAKYYCPFLSRGHCRDEAARCSFSHDDASSIKIPTNYCQYFLANKCLYGHHCKFLHSEPNENGLSNSDGENEFFFSINDHNDSYDDSYSDDYEYAGENTFVASEGSNQNDLDDEDDEESLETHEFPDIAQLAVRHDDEYAYCNRESVSSDSSHEFNDGCSSETVCKRGERVMKNNRELSGNVDNETSHSSSTIEDQSKPFVRKIATRNQHRSLGASNTAASNSSNITINKNDINCNNTKAWRNRQATNEALNLTEKLVSQPLCPYAMENGECVYPIGHCSYLHGLVCDLCGRACLHPDDEGQRRQHRDDCLREHEQEMELSFAVQRSKDKVCGICMDTVAEKKPVTSSRFGILEKCNHIFCLDCIRTWRGTKSFENRTVRACPECRVCSDFVVPSKYWIEDQSDKDKLINGYKAALRSKPCRYFNEGKGECPFAGSCFYKHAYPDGRLAILEPPKPRRKLYGSGGPRATMNYVLWNIMTSTDDDDWSNDDLESLHYLDYATENDDDDDDDYDDDDDDGIIIMDSRVRR